MKIHIDNACVCCGVEIPEGTQICGKCDKENTKWPKENPHIKKTPQIVAYDEDYLYLSNGKKIAAPLGYKFNPDDIKKILEAGDN